MTLRSYANFEEKLTSGLKKDITTWQIFIRALESVKIGVLNWVSTFCAHVDSELKLHKTRIENWLPTEFNFPPITTALCSTTNGESLMVLYTHPYSLGTTLEIFTSRKLCKWYQIPHPSLRIAWTPNKTKTNHHWLNRLQALHTLSYAT